ncbi:MAG TPA: serine/threonine-protein kinase [Thermoanaerobaculaceae bacterium]|nr:serine/threonine-protein kinase [Thermoanaerobaculaceae bacterium]
MVGSEMDQPHQMETWPGGGASTAGDLRLPPRWRVGRRLGAGGQAAVWLAEDLELRQWVAVKAFRPDLSEVARERLRREVRLGRALQHPGLVRIYELIEAGDRLAVVMEWMAGGSLAQRLEAGPLPVAEVVRVADEALAVLEYLHSQHVVHRDLKPSNLLLDADGRVRLGDLGLARPLGDGLDLTRTSTTVGTPAFMSPEQLRGLDPLPASDLYGLGATLFQLLTGLLPFEASSEFEVARLHLTAPAPDPRRLRRDCPTWLARFVRRLMEKRAEDRWPDAGAARRAFEARRGLTSPRARRRVLRAAGVAAAVVTVAFLGGGVIYPLLRRGETVKVEAVDTAVRGLDARARETWRLDLSVPAQKVERADLDGDGQQETVIAAYPVAIDRSAESTAKSEVVIVRPDGTVLSRIHPEDQIPTADFPPYPKRFRVEPRLLDVADDGGLEVVLLCRESQFYPFALEMFWPRLDLWDAVLVHSGWFSDLRVVPGSSPPRLRLAGVNNRMCELPVVAEVEVTPPRALSAPVATAPLASPELGLGRSDRYRYTWYTPLEEGPVPVGVTVESDGSSVVDFHDRQVSVDRWGNPSPGPNAGKDLSAMRGWFLDQSATLENRGLDVNPAVVADRVAQIRRGAEPLLAEAPYRAILGLEFARALARVGDLDRAIRVLESTAGDVPYQDVIYRLSHLEAIAGRLADAARLDSSLLGNPVTSRGAYDGDHLLMRLAIELRDRALLRRALVRIGSWRGVSPELATQLTAALWARAHVWWDELVEADFTVHSLDYTPAGDAIACIARWRSGRTLPGDPERMRQAAEANPDAAWESALALGAAEMGVGRPAEAQATLTRLINALEPESRDDFMNFHVLCLARALHAKALLAAGDVERARSEAQALRPALRPGLLPRILVEEVLAAAADTVPGGPRARAGVPLPVPQAPGTVPR